MLRDKKTPSARRALRRRIGIVIACLLTVFAVFDIRSELSASWNWRDAPRDSVGIAPRPDEVKEALVHVYAARTVKWRGWFAVHPWVAVKPANADTWTTYQVIGFYLKRTGSTVVIRDDEPDRYWYGARPELLSELRGEAAERAIPYIKAAAQSYPYAKEYRAWPGPNSNTFVSHIIRNTPGMEVELPPHAIGKDWIEDGDIFGWSESGTGVQLSALGALGLTVGLAEGIEVNLLGLNFGVDVLRPALKLPFVGRVGMRDDHVFAD